MPLAWLYGRVVAVRQAAYRRGWLRVVRVEVPVLVVGNITVGGSGKTPLTLALIERLVARGRKVGVVSRGYGGKAAEYPCVVATDTTAREAGDEPLLIARISRAAVAVDPVRPRAAQRLIDDCGVDFIVADDGLQHYALARDGEIAVTDTRRGHGNGWLLPVGPLREPERRLDSVDMALAHGYRGDFWLEPGAAQALAGTATRELAAFAGQCVHAVAGIGDPARFFSMLGDYGIDVIAHPMPDHHDFVASDIHFDDDRPVLMTAKDAIKCMGFADARHWLVPVKAVFSEACDARLDVLLDRLCMVRPAGGTSGP